jgi:hypothetical protein
MRRSVTTLSIAVALATPIALASPATAAPVTVTVSCTAGPLSASPSSFSAGIGDVITVSNASGGSFTVGTTTATGNGTLIVNSASNTFTVTSGSGGQLVFNPIGGGACTTGAVNFTAGGSNGTSSGDSSAPIPEIQQFGKPASETCEAAAPVSLNWSGVSSGGWSESWAQWMNGGNGGAVCTRTLVYSTGQSRWVVG